MEQVILLFFQKLLKFNECLFVLGIMESYTIQKVNYYDEDLIQKGFFFKKL